MKEININGVPYLVDEAFQDYTFHKTPSSNVDVFGYDDSGNFLVQFNNGGTYVHNNVLEADIKGAISSTSIGKYYRTYITKYGYTKMDEPAVTRA